MAQKVAKTGITRDDKKYLYYIKGGAVYQVERKQPGARKGKSKKVDDAGIEMDPGYIYFLDKDGDVSRARRAVGGQKRKKAPKKKKVAKKKVAKKKAPKKKKVAKKKAPKKKKVAKKKAPKKKAPKKKAPKKKAKKK